MRFRANVECKDTTYEEFANWLLQLPVEIRSKKIWYVDLNLMYKSKPVDFVASPSKEYLGLEELHDSEEGEEG